MAPHLTRLRKQALALAPACAMDTPTMQQRCTTDAANGAATEALPKRAPMIARDGADAMSACEEKAMLPPARRPRAPVLRESAR